MEKIRRRYGNWDSGVFPRGRKRGILREPKPKGYRERCGAYRDIIGRAIPESVWEVLCAEAEHQAQRSRFRFILEQDGIGSCAAESACACLGAIAARMGQPLVLPNPLFLYHTTSGGRDNGSVIGDNVTFLMENGCCPEEVWPRYKGFRAEPSDEAKKIAAYFKLLEAAYVENIPEALTGLFGDYPLHFGHSGHAIAGWGYLGSKRIGYANSWSEEWGDKGFGTLSVNNIRFDYGAYIYLTMMKYATPTKGGKWKWLCDWQPKHDQALLAKAVVAYERKCLAKPNAWVDKNPNWREDEYNQSLAKFGLSV